MANRIMSTAEVEGATIWFSPSANLWWMDSTNAQKAREKISRYPDAIHVTNAYDVLDQDFVHHLITVAER